jgi:hypothetical protein
MVDTPRRVLIGYGAFGPAMMMMIVLSIFPQRGGETMNLDEPVIKRHANFLVALPREPDNGIVDLLTMYRGRWSGAVHYFLKALADPM